MDIKTELVRIKLTSVALKNFMLATYQEKLDRDPNDLWSTESKTEKEKKQSKKAKGWA